jgi:hypothetical protein
MTVRIADARKTSGAEFVAQILGPYEPKRQAIYEQCIRAIRRGDLHAWPPAMVEHCRKLMAEQEPLTDVEDLGPGRIAA